MNKGFLPHDVNKLIDPVTNKRITVLGTIHTHLNQKGDPSPSYYTPDGYGDAGYFGKNTPNRPFLTIGYDGNIHGGYSSIPNGTGVPIFHDIDSLLKSENLTLKTLMSGYNLAGLLKK